MDGGTTSDGLIRIDAANWFPSVEEGGDKPNDIWDAGGTTDQEDLVYFGLVRPGIPEDLLDGVEGALEEVVT